MWDRTITTSGIFFERIAPPPEGSKKTEARAMMWAGLSSPIPDLRIQLYDPPAVLFEIVDRLLCGPLVLAAGFICSAIV
jgi:hypothetical protein